MRWLLWVGVLAMGCSGKGKDDDTGLGGDDCNVGSSRLDQVAATEWPTGLTEAIPRYNNIGGRWSASSSCGGEVVLKFVNHPQEDLLVVTAPYDPAQACGCTTDPAFPDDAKLDAVALHEDFEIFVEAFTDPALDGRTIVGGGALYGPSAAIQVRGCATDDVDPILQSAYDQVSVVVRVDAGGVMTGSFVLVPVVGGVEETCDLTGFSLIEAL